MTIRIAQAGLGPIGLASLQLAATKPWVEILGAVDPDPKLRDRDLGELIGVPQLSGLRVHGTFGELCARGKPDIVLHTTVSRFKDAFPQIVPLVEQGISVVSSCEELVFPRLGEPELAAELDRLCQERKARVLGTGVNPGFVMDLLPLCLTGVSCSVQAVHITRVVNASTRREPLQRKIGSGQPPDVFRRALQSGTAGHAGLRESMALVAHGLGWTMDETVRTADVIVADRRISTRYFEVLPGQTCGQHQRVEGKCGGQLRLSLDIKMYLEASPAHDTIRIEGEPPLELTIREGVAGDQATVAALLNAVPRVLAARPGLLLGMDLPLPKFA